MSGKTTSPELPELESLRLRLEDDEGIEREVEVSLDFEDMDQGEWLAAVTIAGGPEELLTDEGEVDPSPKLMAAMVYVRLVNDHGFTKGAHGPVMEALLPLFEGDTSSVEMVE